MKRNGGKTKTECVAKRYRVINKGISKAYYGPNAKTAGMSLKNADAPDGTIFGPSTIVSCHGYRTTDEDGMDRVNVAMAVFGQSVSSVRTVYMNGGQTIGDMAELVDSSVAENAVIGRGASLDHVWVGAECTIGEFASLKGILVPFRMAIPANAVIRIPDQEQNLGEYEAPKWVLMSSVSRQYKSKNGGRINIHAAICSLERETAGDIEHEYCIMISYDNGGKPERDACFSVMFNNGKKTMFDKADKALIAGALKHDVNQKKDIDNDIRAAVLDTIDSIMSIGARAKSNDERQ